MEATQVTMQDAPTGKPLSRYTRIAIAIINMSLTLSLLLCHSHHPSWVEMESDELTLLGLEHALVDGGTTMVCDDDDDDDNDNNDSDENHHHHHHKL